MLYCSGKFDIDLRALYLFLLLYGSCRRGILSGFVNGEKRINNVMDVNCTKYYIFEEINSNPMVKTNSGAMVGKYVNISGIIVAASFLRVPYAKPPLNEYRFKKADPVEPWEGILETNTEVPFCMQHIAHITALTKIPSEITEDCLFLNVFAPTKCCCAEYGKLPVLVWIPGGAFSVSNSATFDGTMLSYYGKVIVVTVNYRLGVFGYFNGGTDEAPGNAGMYDQVLAIEWVRENIGYFGGDSNQITLLGQSSGGQSVHLHLLSPISRNLFHRAIVQSGSMNNPIYTDTLTISRKKANVISNAVHCANSSVNMDTHPKEVIQCLKQIDAMTLAIAESTLRPDTNLYFLPSIGNEFLPKLPMLADSEDFAPVDVLTGNVKDEVSFLISFKFDKLFPFDREPSLNLSTAKKIFPIILEPVSKSLHKKVSNFYLKDIAEDDSPAIVEALKHGLGDFLFYCPGLFLAEKLNRPYVYWWTYITTLDENAAWIGAFHGRENPYLIGNTFLTPEIFSLEDRKYSRYIIHEWVNFAVKGKPLEDGSVFKWKQWNPFLPSTAETYKLSANHQHSIPFPRKEACEFWRPIFASYPTE